MILLLTNDDGIEAHGLIRLARAAASLGEVWVIAPDSQRSAASHSITLRHMIDMIPRDDFPVENVRAFACSGTPSDCVRAGIIHMLPQKPDLVLSGINFGYNMASDVQYSATVGAAFEAAHQGVQAIAFSEGTGEDHRLTDERLPEVLQELAARPLPFDRIYNVNFPQCAPEECRGILRDRALSRGGLYRDRYQETEKLAGGGFRLQVNGVYQEEAEEGTDFRALLDRYISIGVLRNIS